METRRVGGVAGLWVLLAHGAAAQPDYDFQWAKIGDPGNPAYPGDDIGRMAGRGSVPYTYRMSRLEVTTGQWMEYVNTFSTQSDDLKYFSDPVHWGADVDPTYQGPGRRWALRDVPDAAMLPVTGVSWREAAQYCNWLHNGKSAELDAIKDGAYDTSTFFTNPDGTYTDQLTHHPDALFWIPTLDEWIKAGHYDPDHGDPGAGGWWKYPGSSDTALIIGPPGEGQTSGGWVDPDGDGSEWDIPLGAYSEVVSPWGLWDVSGGVAEWLEEPSKFDPGELPKQRGDDGSWVGASLYLAELQDRVSVKSSSSPQYRYSNIGLRIASAVPTPGSSVAIALLWVLSQRRRRFR